MKVKIAIIGTGRIGRLHLKNIAALRELYEIVAIADPYDKNLAALATEYNVPFYTTDYKEIFTQTPAEAIVIASSTDTHAEIILAGVAHSKVIFCEKPIDTSLERIKEVLKAVEDAGALLQIGFNRRFDHNFRKVQETVVAGNIGQPHIIKITSRDPEPPAISYIKISGGLFNDMMIHDFDMARYLSGSEVVEVYANGAVLVDPAIGEAGDIDTAIVTLKFANGALGVIDNSRQAKYGYDQRVEVFGSKGQVVAYNDHKTNVEIDTVEGGLKDKIPFFFLDRYEQAYRDQFKEFYQVVINKTAPIVDGQDGLKSVVIAKAALRSLQEGKPVAL